LGMLVAVRLLQPANDNATSVGIVAKTNSPNRYLCCPFIEKNVMQVEITNQSELRVEPTKSLFSYGRKN
jgi:hypothetical protein